MTTLFGIFTRFYQNLGTALAELVASSSLSIEINYGSVLDFADSVRKDSTERQRVGLPTTYTRIFLSNVPDYIGMLSTIVQLYGVFING